jgi:hypothetical protein
MKRTVASILFVGLMFSGAQAFAQEQHSMSTDPPSNQPSSQTNSPSTSAKHQAMKDCMARQKANNSGMSKADMKKACKDEMKMQKDNQHSPQHP